MKAKKDHVPSSQYFAFIPSTKLYSHKVAKYFRVFSAIADIGSASTDFYFNFKKTIGLFDLVLSKNRFASFFLQY